MGREPTEMELRVAKALYDGRNLGAECVQAIALPSWKDTPSIYRTPWILKARAAIRAMHEPTENMLTAAVEVAIDHYAGDGLYLHTDKQTWCAMIDAASPPIEEK